MANFPGKRSQARKGGWCGHRAGGRAYTACLSLSPKRIAAMASAEPRCMIAASTPSGKRAVVDLSARIGAEDDERAFGALLGPDGDERARCHPFTALASISVDRIASRAKGVILARSGRMSA
jgi:hypothetical protein